MIATTNTILSVIGLIIMGFPRIFALAFMIFILSIVPVAGVFISLIPLCLIALLTEICVYGNDIQQRQRRL
ncbi:AI-2E family transporter [Clostridium estertheticum]|nr:AI-2E family transporter [Clostridium estertheticum]MBU3074857.1 AI-2E family transporter [Clostridium estertheticum]MBU3165072.1 AI-2E family transporter [Clostridium estertheticum]